MCRYCFAEEGDADEITTACEVCGAKENLWMCLICGHVGCDRYSHEHAIAHFRSTGHTYSLEVATQRVWDYSGDGFVHRLIQNKTDGKIVEIPDIHSTSDQRSRVPPDTDVTDAEHQRMMAQKAEAVAYEYTILLTSQLEVQRQYYDGLLSQVLSLVPEDGDSRRAAAELVVQHHNPTGGSCVSYDGLGDLPDKGASIATGNVTPTAQPRKIKSVAKQAASNGSVPTEGVPSAHPPGGTAPSVVAGATNSSSSARGGRERRPPAGVGAQQLHHSKEVAAAANGDSTCDVASSCTSCAALRQHLAESERDKRVLARQMEDVVQRAVRQAEDLAFLRDMSDTLTKNQSDWEAKYAVLEATRCAEAAAAAARQAELEEQVRDLMFFLDNSKKFANVDGAMRDDLDAGHVVITTVPDASAHTGKRTTHRKGGGGAKGKPRGSVPAGVGTGVGASSGATVRRRSISPSRGMEDDDICTIAVPSTTGMKSKGARGKR